MLQENNDKGTILETQQYAVGVSNPPSVSWERCHFSEVTLSWALKDMGKTNRFQRNHDKENLIFKSNFKKNNHPSPFLQKVKDMNKQYTEEEKEMGYAGNREM